MTVSPTGSSALQGLHHASRGLRRNAVEIAGSVHTGNRFPAKDLVRAMVELHRHNRQAAASIAAFEAGDRAIGSLLDIEA